MFETGTRINAENADFLKISKTFPRLSALFRVPFFQSLFDLHPECVRASTIEDAMTKNEWLKIDQIKICFYTFYLWLYPKAFYHAQFSSASLTFIRNASALAPSRMR
jgi:hypothetical protein